jgi:uncharacterized protein
VFDPITLYVLIVLFFATLIRSTFGFGEALVAVPLLAMRLPLTVAAPLAVLVSIVIAAAVVVQDWRHVQVRSAAGLIFASLPGIPLGVWLLTKGNEHVVKSLLGCFIVAFSIYSLMARHTLRLNSEDSVWLIACGFLSGVLGGAYGMNGPPLAIYGALRGWSPRHFRATLQGYFLPASFVGFIGYVALGLYGAAITRYFFLSLPVIAIAVVLGRTINLRMKGQNFFRFVYLGLIVVGGILVFQTMGK